ncbi:DUF3566 domain-containing protein [Actinomadura sp. NEAU-AAG7]|uniref:DUF3566 domain-containing protein n=1 Tax=Actinomadura sp. NEAU-AAG7 TaxID=2839640 RepID=UPI0027DEAB84|nr:DUF3566 domain-containing protein [Actinomadura sp. NEAU-AAG7]
MSTEPGKSKGGSGADAGGEAPAKRPGGKSGKTVAAASAKPGRDEATVEITSADETRADLAHIEDESEKSEASEGDTPEIAPIKDTTEPPSSDDRPATSSSSDKPSDPARSSSPSSGSKSSSGWSKPAESPGSGTRPRKPFGRRDTPSSNSSGSGGTSSSPKSSGGFAGTVLKDRPAPAAPAVAPSSTKPAVNAKPARKAQLQLARLEPWSVMKFSFVMSVVCFVVLLVAVTVLYTILAGLGVFDAISDTINSLTKQQGETTGGVDAGSWFSFFRVFGYTVLVGALNVLLITALSTVGSVIYNLAADLVGGVEVTLKEAE